MDLSHYAQTIQRQLVVAAEAGGDDARALAERLVAPLDAAIRLTLQEALAVAAEEITCELAPGSVELRVRGRELEFVVTPSPTGQTDRDQDDDDPATNSWLPPDGSAMAAPGAGEPGAMQRINVRMPDHLKTRVEQAAGAEGLSVNSWLVRAAATALGGADPARRSERRTPQGAQRYTGWAR